MGASQRLFITFEGIDGVGKSLHCDFVRRALEARGVLVCTLREPGGTRLGERVRRLLLDTGEAHIDPTSELLLYEAARAQLVSESILPALEQGRVVLCDRFYDSTTACQGYGRRLDLELVRSANSLACASAMPVRTILLDLEPEVAYARATRTGIDRLEAEGIAFQSRVRDGYLALASEEPQRIRVIDGHGGVQLVWTRVREALGDLFDLPEQAPVYPNEVFDDA